jgi:hypothetical protein
MGGESSVLVAPSDDETLRLAGPYVPVMSPYREAAPRPLLPEDLQRRWFLLTRHGDQGPFSWEAILLTTAAGVLGPADLVRPAGEGEWRSLATVRDLHPHLWRGYARCAQRPLWPDDDPSDES